MPLSAAPGGSSDTPEESCSDSTWFNTRLISFGLRAQVIELKQGGKARSTV
jgi:hypothetical protein